MSPLTLQLLFMRMIADKVNTCKIYLRVTWKCVPLLPFHTLNGIAHVCPAHACPIHSPSDWLDLNVSLEHHLMTQEIHRKLSGYCANGIPIFSICKTCAIKLTRPLKKSATYLFSKRWAPQASVGCLGNIRNSCFAIDNSGFVRYSCLHESVNLHHGTLQLWMQVTENQSWVANHQGYTFWDYLLVCWVASMLPASVVQHSVHCRHHCKALGSITSLY